MAELWRAGSSWMPAQAGRVIDAEGLWLMPGLFDIHTHYDLELEVAPGLPESTRHGTTSVVIANCSLGLAFGAQRDGTNDPIVSCYARVENIPKHVLRTVPIMSAGKPPVTIWTIWKSLIWVPMWWRYFLTQCCVSRKWVLKTALPATPPAMSWSR